MQIVINISEESYKNIKEQVDKRDYPDMQIGRAIVGGTQILENDVEEYKEKLLEYVMQTIQAEKTAMGSIHDLATEDYHKGILYAFECMKMKLM